METRQRSILRPIREILAAVLLLSAATALADQKKIPFRPSSEQIVTGLRQKQAKELTRYLRGLPHLLREMDLSDRQMDSLLAELRRIQETDPYQEKVSGWIGIGGVEIGGIGIGRVGIGGQKAFINREVAALIRFTLPEWVEHRRLRIWLESLRELPLEERTTKILSRIESLQRPLEETHPLVRGLGRMGGSGVPFMLRYPSQDNNVRLSLVEALSHIRDPRGADYIIGLLQTKGEYAFPHRGRAVRALAGLGGEKVVRALIGVLEGDPFPVRREAARSLTAVTGRQFGLLFNEEAKTWTAWLASQAKETFKPAEIQRSPREIESLIERLFDRYLSARIKTPDNAEDFLLDQKRGRKRLVEELRLLGKPAVPMMVLQCRIRMEQNPRQEKELKRWTRRLLRALKWPEARRAAASI